MHFIAHTSLNKIRAEYPSCLRATLATFSIILTRLKVIVLFTFSIGEVENSRRGVGGYGLHRKAANTSLQNHRPSENSSARQEKLH